MTVMDIDFPFRVDSRGRTATADHPGHIREMIEQLLFTVPGERVNRPDFGCGLLDLVFAPNSVELAAALQMAAEAALQRWLGDVIAVSSLTVTAVEETLKIEVRYVISATGQQVTDVIQGSGPA